MSCHFIRETRGNRLNVHFHELKLSVFDEGISIHMHREKPFDVSRLIEMVELNYSIFLDRNE